MRSIFAAAAVLSLAAAASAEINLLGTAVIPADAKDKSGLEGEVMKNDGVTPAVSTAKDGTTSTVPADRFGGAGSAIAYTGKDDLYIEVTDRGPGDGEALYSCRAHIVRIKIDPAAAAPVDVTLEKTILLKDGDKQLSGSARAFMHGTRFDPEGVRVAAAGGDFYVSDEYGPYVRKFSAAGKQLAEYAIPEKFKIKQRSDSGVDETRMNDKGRQTNKGIEGLAISPDGKKLFGLMQGPLIQDSEPAEEDNKRIGENCRLIEIDLASGKTREFVYQLDEPKLSLNEILAVNDHSFLVMERDTKEGKKAEHKKIVRIDIANATDVSDLEKLPVKGLPAGVKAVSKSPFLDMLDPKFNLAGAKFPDKIEGLAFGPDIGGKHTLVVTNDNDFRADTANYYWVFTLDADDLKDYVPQKFE